MTVALDANLLLRFFDVSAAQHATAVVALAALRSQGHALRTLPQTIYEFWVVATRPIANNGLGLSIAECDRTIVGILTAFPILDDPPGLFVAWRALAVAHDCKGKVAHDARYAAALSLHGLTHFLTFNGSDFTRYAGLTILDPSAVASSSSPPPASPIP